MCFLQDRFESVNRAYEFLCSRNSWPGQGSNSDNTVLILRTQSILFQRYSEGVLRHNSVDFICEEFSRSWITII
jgi:hypothetical protein